MVVSLWEHEELILDSEARLNKLDDIREAIVDSYVEVAEPQEISVFGDRYFAIVDPFDDLEYLLLLFVTLDLVHHVFH